MLKVLVSEHPHKPLFNDTVVVGALAENNGIRSGVRQVIADLRRDCSHLPYLSAIELERYINDTIKELEGLL